MHRININENEINKLKHFKTEDFNTESKLYTMDNLMYKIFFDNSIHIETKEQIINYLLEQNLNCKNIILPKNKIFINNIFKGYTMDYVQNSSSISSFVNDNNSNFSLEKRKKFMLELNNSIKEIHKANMYYGDIHQGNIIIDNFDLYLIDIDSLRINNISEHLMSLYRLKEVSSSNTKKEENFKTDIIKMNIILLSLLYQADFELLYMRNGLKFLRDIIDALYLPNDIAKEFKNNLNLELQPKFLSDKILNLSKYENSKINEDSTKLKKLINKKYHKFYS